MNLREGLTVDDRYTLIRRLGQGGQGSVWKAFDKNTGEHRALKIVDLRGGDEEAAARAHREARLVRGVNHPAVVTCHSWAEIAQGDLLVLVFDFVSATPLSEAQQDSRFGRIHKLAALRHIAGALAHLHRKGVVHRDLKPDNILVTPLFWEDPAAPSGLKIIDFGIAAPKQGAEGATLSGRFGTPAYMAPELFGVASLDAQRSPARDVFAFGVIGWELLEGGHPTDLGRGASLGGYAACYEHARLGRSPWPPRAPQGTWGSVVSACLALEPAARPADGAAILELLGESPRTPGPANVEERSQPLPSRNKQKKADIDGVTAPHATPAPEPTVTGAPAKTVLSTERAPDVSPPRSSTVDRTTPMPPDAVTGRVSTLGVRDETDPRHGRSKRPAEKLKTSRARLLIVTGVVLAVLGASAAAWELQEKSDPQPAAVPSRATMVMAGSTQPPQAPAPTSSTMATTASAPAVVVCCGRGKTECLSGWTCQEGECKTDVPERDFRLRVFQVDRDSPYDEERLNLAKEYAQSTICVRTLRTPDAKDEVCERMTDITPTKKGVKPDRVPQKRLLRVNTSDIKKTGIGLRLRNGSNIVLDTTMVGTGGLKTTALCGSLAMNDAAREYVLTFYLEDPDPSPFAP